MSSPPPHQTGSIFPGGGLSQAMTTAPLTSGTAKPAPSVIETLSNRMVGLRVDLWHRVLLYAKAVGLTIGHSPEALNETN